MSSKREPITPTEAKRSLQALEILSGKRSAPANRGKTGKREQPEAKIQEMLFEWAGLLSGKYPELELMYHVPNEGKRSIISGYRLKQGGLKAGVPDICLPVARGTFYGLYIELKADKGRLQENQRQWLDALAGQGYKAAVCYGFDEARTAIEDYLKGAER